LKHVATNYRLHSHGVNYGSGSGQQSVTTFPGKDDTNSYWVVRGNNKVGYCKTGDKIKNGGTIRLQHLNTKKNLHSHLHPSPLTNQQEVSAYGDNGSGDTGDDWKVELSSGTHWKREEAVKFKHVDTGKYLQSNRNQYRNPIPGQQEVACTTTKDNMIEWAAEEGIYFPTDFSEQK
jgi:dolichyl-phosphate-mannose--protein O-mannosyl transferase